MGITYHIKLYHICGAYARTGRKKMRKNVNKILKMGNTISVDIIVDNPVYNVDKSWQWTMDNGQWTMKVSLRDGFNSCRQLRVPFPGDWRACEPGGCTDKQFYRSYDTIANLQQSGLTLRLCPALRLCKTKRLPNRAPEPRSGDKVPLGYGRLPPPPAALPCRPPVSFADSPL